MDRIQMADPARLGVTLLPDGRRLGWAEWGPAGGMPVLFCPGAATSRWLGFGSDVVDELGIRLISVDRPGLGASDPQPGRTLTDWARDVAAFTHARNLTGLSVVGFSQGAPFALACAAAGVVKAAAVVAGTDELASPALQGALVPDVRKMVESVAPDPAGAEAFFAGMTEAMMWEMVIGMSAGGDRAVYTAPAFAQAFRQAMAEGFAQGAAGYARDTVLSMSAWPFDPAAIAVPVDLWYGLQDASPVHSPDFGATLAGRMPAAKRHLVAEAGGALLWTHAGEILTALKEACRR